MSVYHIYQCYHIYCHVRVQIGLAAEGCLDLFSFSYNLKLDNVGSRGILVYVYINATQITGGG